jgi:hypothetical protein
MNLIVEELHWERAAHGLIAATDLVVKLRKNYMGILECMQKYAATLSEHSQTNAALLLQYLEKLTLASSATLPIPRVSFQRGARAVISPSQRPRHTRAKDHCAGRRIGGDA